MGEEAPLVELLKDLAAEMDAGGGTRARADYLSALKDVRRVLSSAPGSAGASAVERAEKNAAPAEKPVETDEDAGVADFASFKRAKGGASAG